LRPFAQRSNYILDTSVTYSEAELVALLRGRTEEAFRYLYRHYAAGLLAVVRRIVCDEPTAEDVLQEAFVKIWRSVDAYDEKRGRLYTWMLNIARNSAIDKLRTRGEIMRGKIRGDEVLVDGFGAPAASQSSTDGIGVDNLVSALRAEQRTVVELAYYQGYTLDEISKMLDVPLGTIKTRMRAALQKLRKVFCA